MLALKCTGNMGFSDSHEGYMGSSGALPCDGLEAGGVYAKLKADFVPVF